MNLEVLTNIKKILNTWINPFSCNDVRGLIIGEIIKSRRVNESTSQWSRHNISKAISECISLVTKVDNTHYLIQCSPRFKESEDYLNTIYKIFNNTTITIDKENVKDFYNNITMKDVIEPNIKSITYNQIINKIKQIEF
jgi:hypothetical protein